MSQGPLCPNLSLKVQKEVSQMANRNLSRVILLGGLSVNLNHLKTTKKPRSIGCRDLRPCSQCFIIETSGSVDATVPYPSGIITLIK